MDSACMYQGFCHDSVMNNKEIIERLAIFLWGDWATKDTDKKTFCNIYGYTDFLTREGCHHPRDISFDPTYYWHHWRQVELKMMEDEALYVDFFSEYFIPEMMQNTGQFKMALPVISYINSDLPTRCKALVSIL